MSSATLHRLFDDLLEAHPLGPAALPPGSVLGVMGGGQLGRMLAHAAQRVGYRVAVLEPDAGAPALQVVAQPVVGAYDDPRALDTLAEQAQAITTEFENVPAASLAHLARTRPVRPSAESVAVCQDRAAEKAHFVACQAACAPHAVIRTEADGQALSPDLFPGVLKTAQMGYDGKGQVSVERAEDWQAAWAQLGQVPCVLEKRLNLRMELSVILARGHDGAWVHLPVQRNWHQQGILAVTEVPAPGVSEDLAAQAVATAGRIAEGLGHVGVLCVEFFVLDDGALVVNEMAPRPHNSGHYSLDACDQSQFDLQVRTLAGLPLTAPRQHSHAIMLNVLGDLWFPEGQATPREPDWARVMGFPGVHVHLYGKAQPRAGRKMGHITLTGSDPLAVRRVAAAVLHALSHPDHSFDFHAAH